MKSYLLLFTFMLYCTSVLADQVDMRDYIKVRNGMSEAEVLYLLGPYDHETIRADGFDYVFERTWFYIPFKKGSNKWITEIHFNSRGEVKKRDRYRVK